MKIRLFFFSMLLAGSAHADVVRFNNVEFEATAWGSAVLETADGTIGVSPSRGEPGDGSWGNCVITLEPGIAWDRVDKIRLTVEGNAAFDLRVRVQSDANRGFVPSLVFDKDSVDGAPKTIEISAKLLKARAADGDLPDALVVGVGTDLGNRANRSKLRIKNVEVVGGGLEPPAHDRARTTGEWLDAMQDPVTGLVRSYESEWNCFAYDQGAWAIAQCALGKREAVEKLFKSLTALQEPDGLLRAGYHWKTGRVVFDQPSPGQMAWIGMGINAYTVKYGNREFVPMAEKLAGYIISQQDDDGGVIGVHGNVPWKKGEDFRSYMLWKSTEEAVDVFSFLHHLGEITGEAKYKEAAGAARQFVESMWDEGHGMFCQGVQKKENETQFERDLRFPGDVQYWTVMATGPKGIDGQNYTKSLDLCEKKLAVTDGDLSGISYSQEYVKAYPDCIWWDQTFSLAAAFDSIGDKRRSKKYFSSAEKARRPAGAFALTTAGKVPNPVWPVMPRASVAATSWYVYTKEGVNPFHPNRR